MEEEEKIKQSLAQFRAIFEDSGHEYLTTSDSDDEDNPADPVSQFTVHTKDHGQEYVSLDNEDQSWEPVASTSTGSNTTGQNTSRKRKRNASESSVDSTSSSESEPVPSTSRGITRDKKKPLAFMKRGSQIDVKVTRELHRQEQQFRYYDELYLSLIHI